VPVLLLLLALIVIAGILLCESKLALHTLKKCKVKNLTAKLIAFIYKMKLSFSIFREAKEENQICVRHVSQSFKCYLCLI